MTTYCFDIDGTICTNTDGDYHLAEPYLDRIKVIVDLQAMGHTVIFHTARGSTTGRDWGEFTVNQLKSWGLDNPVVYLGKPYAEVYVDDKAVPEHTFFA